MLRLYTIAFVLIIASCNHAERTPNCNDPISVEGATDLMRKLVAAMTMAKLTDKFYQICYEEIDQYKSGQKFDEKTTRNIEQALELANGLEINLRDIRPTKIDESIKKCKCYASIVLEGKTIPISYSVQRTDEGTFVKLEDF